MQVLKFGGTSVADTPSMLQTVEIVLKALERDRTIVVASAINGCTDNLIDIGLKASSHDAVYRTLIEDLRQRHHEIIRTLLPEEKQAEALVACDRTFASLSSIAHGVDLLGELSPASLDAIQGCGELLSTRILATKFASLGVSCKWIDSRDIIRTSSVRGHNVVDSATTFANVRKMLETNPLKSLFIVPGFIASDGGGRMTTLGRGGSDYSASLYAVGAKARALETWKDVPGMMTANPRIVPQARPIHHISYRAALELSHFGAKVIYPPTIQPVVAEHIPIYVKCTFDPSLEGTLIEQNPPRGSNKLIGISNSDDIALLSLEGSGMVDVPGYSYRLFQTLSDNDISIMLITQASSVNTMCVAVAGQDAEKARQAVDSSFAYELSLGLLNPLKVETGYSVVCLVGDDMFSQSGTTGRMLDALGRRSVSVRAVAQGSSERNISVVVRSEDAPAAMRYIHDEFFETSPYRDINLFIAGAGNVGGTLIAMIMANRERIASLTGRRLHIAGISDSRRYMIAPEGLTLEPDKAAPKALLSLHGKPAEGDAFFDQMAELSLQNSVFVDCTASQAIACKYTGLMRRGYSIVACNKLAFSDTCDKFSALRRSAVEYGVGLHYETTVGSAMPILETISRCVCSGDSIVKVEAALSGTLSYIFSTYRGGTDGHSFASVVRRAEQEGYTEPDPRQDLCCRDVLRKLLILSREAGVPLEEEDVEAEPLLPKGYLEGDKEAFYAALERDEPHFSALYRQASEAGKLLKFTAVLERDGESWHASMGLRQVLSDHPLGTDGGAVITTALYPGSIVIRGAGAGAANTASGLLNDILHQ